MHKDHDPTESRSGHSHGTGLGTQESEISCTECLFSRGTSLGRALGGRTTEPQGLEKQEDDSLVGPTFPAPPASKGRAAGARAALRNQLHHVGFHFGEGNGETALQVTLGTR